MRVARSLPTVMLALVGVVRERDVGCDQEHGGEKGDCKFELHRAEIINELE